VARTSASGVESGASVSPALTPKPASASVTEMTEYVLPSHANALGTVFGGQIMAWVDICAAICAQRHSGRTCVTLFIDDFLFQKPVHVGQVVRLRAHVLATFRTSMEIAVSVSGEDTMTGRQWSTVACLVTMVALGDDRRPVPVPALLVVSEAERHAQTAAESRKQARLAKRRP
jgi:acyl-CoA hydrolase